MIHLISAFLFFLSIQNLTLFNQNTAEVNKDPVEPA